jgi:hypothetical protein
MPWPKWDSARRSGRKTGSSVTTVRSEILLPPFHSAITLAGNRISHPMALAMVSGKQR